jgi:predicted lipase
MKHKTLLELAALAYEDWHYKIEGFEYRIDEYSTCTVVSIAGTKDFKDLITDLRFIPRFEDGMGMVAGGFFDVAVDMSMGIALSVPRGVPLVLTGHSAGGALALLCGAHIASNGREIKEIVTFGAPRVGRLKVLDDVHHCMYRNGRDLVSYTGLRGSGGKLVKVGKASKWWPNLADHKLLRYAEAV